MDVRIERQARGIVPTVPRPGSGQPPAARASAADNAPHPTELFDANGDGVIENWSIAHGGDSFANFDPPPSGAAPSESKPNKSAAADAAAHRARTSDTGAPRSTPAAFHHAHDAYQRDGMGAAAPATPPPAAAATAPVPAADEPTAPPVVTQPAATPALRSTAL